MSDPTCHCGHVEDEHIPGGPCQVDMADGDEPTDCPCIHFELNEDATDE